MGRIPALGLVADLVSWSKNMFDLESSSLTEVKDDSTFGF
jgi:hypothetical protein